MKLTTENPVNLFVTILFLILTFGCGTRNIDRNKSNSWNLIWEDDFEYNGKPDDTKWSHAPRGRADWARFCTDSDSTRFVKNGNLHLRGILNSNPNDTVKYSTGCIRTADKFAFKYGKIEVKAKLDKGKGSWPAIWMMPQNPAYGGWPHSGEIDIMEHLNNDTIVYQTIHSNYVTVQKKKEDPEYFTTVPFKVDEFNTYGLEWYPDRLDFFLNGKHTFTYPKVENADFKQWPFDQDFFIILDQALGGSWVGRIADEDLPVEMLVDWVKVYQKN